MTKEKSSIQKLEEFAKRSGRHIETDVKVYPSNALQPVAYHIRNVCIPNNAHRSTYFASFSDTRRMDGRATYSGVFFPIDVYKDTNIRVRPKHIIDKLNFFDRNKGYKTGFQSFDSKVVFEEFYNVGGSKIFTNRKVQDVILRAMDFDIRLRVGVNCVNLDFIPELKGKSHFGIYTRQDWFVNPEKIEILFEFAEVIRNHVVNVEPVSEMI